MEASTRVRLLRIRSNMIRRCYDPDCHHFDRYGGRGIRIQDSWIGSPKRFAAWAFANGYADDLQIDRIDNDGDYCAENCRWVTASVNQHNRRAAVLRRKSSRFTGVYVRATGRISAYITINGARKWLGDYATEEDAARAYDAESIARYGATASLNFKTDIAMAS